MEMPLIDLSPFGSGVCRDEEKRDAAARSLDAACRDHGFSTLIGCGISREAVKDAFAGAKELFLGMSATEKESLARLNLENRGYSPFAKESLNRKRAFDQKESFNVRFSGNDFRGCPAKFVEASTALIEAGREACRRYTEASAVALDLPVDYFSRHFDALDLCTLRFIHYPPCQETGSEVSDSGNIRLGEHTDFGMFTLLFVDSSSSAYRGLQLRPEGSEAWLDVDHAGDADCLVNTGALAARWTNDVWRATEHRVIVPDAESARGHRFSIAFFFDPDAATLVEVHNKFCSEGLPPRYDPITAKDYLISMLKKAQGK